MPCHTACCLTCHISAAGRQQAPYRRIKFGAFYDHIAQRPGEPFDRIASGHYALIDRGAGEDAPVQLRMTPDAIKDQTYFLAGLVQAQLARCTFPLGCLTKVRLLSVNATASVTHVLDA